MRLILCCALIALMGCASNPRGLVFNIRAADVATASPEPLDGATNFGNTNAPDFKAQIHIVFLPAGARKFHDFTRKHTGQVYELQVEGEVLLPGVGARASAGQDVWWFTTSMEQAQHFAALLSKK